MKLSFTLNGEEVEIAAEPGVLLVDLLLKNDLLQPRKIVWLAWIPELRRLAAGTAGELVLGATVTLRELARSAAAGRQFPALAYAAGRVGNPRVRAVATVGSALAHSDARQDLPPILYALQARIRIQGPQGAREVPVAEFHTGFMETVLAEDELVTEVVIPGVPGWRAAYARFTPGSRDDYPTVSAAASAVRDGDGRVTSAVLALGGGRPDAAAGTSGVRPRQGHAWPTGGGGCRGGSGGGSRTLRRPARLGAVQEGHGPRVGRQGSAGLPGPRRLAGARRCRRVAGSAVALRKSICSMPGRMPRSCPVAKLRPLALACMLCRLYAVGNGVTRLCTRSSSLAWSAGLNAVGTAPTRRVSRRAATTKGVKQMRISAELNRKLTEVGPGTAMGEVFRRYWIPACLAEEVGAPDGAPVRVRLLGEDLVAFRDSAGDVGLVDAYCAHRRAPLFYGRNEECGLRCVYHGWKFDTLGNCVDMPSEPPYSKFRLRVSIPAYPTYEGGGVIWAYLGPTEFMPPPPDYEWMRAGADHMRINKTGEPCNYLQAIEGGIDTAHSSFAHNNDLDNPRLLRTLDPHPRLDVDIKDYGYTYASLRNISQDTTYLRVYQFVMPSQQFRGGLLDAEGNKAKIPAINGHIWVPIDDENVYVYNWMYVADESATITSEWWDRHEHAMGRGPQDFLPGSYWLKAQPGNDFFIDRQVQRTKTFTGIQGVNTQDFALQTGMGRIVDRSREALGSTDHAIQAARRLLIEAMDDVKHERPLKGTDPHTYARVRGTDMLIPRGTDWRDASKESAQAYW